MVNLSDSMTSGPDYLKKNLELDDQIVEKLIRSVNMNFYT